MTPLGLDPAPHPASCSGPPQPPHTGGSFTLLLTVVARAPGSMIPAVPSRQGEAMGYNFRESATPTIDPERCTVCGQCA
jgi:hypothetical protein